ncbi:PAS domain-containing protein [Williamwhitmania taraxaci]|uniref:PAS domain S-box-containing protein n=1 Tax=Williamwhitmania taraxaci TaxID=1640674 RepID=A0A1G6PRI9_9BACT|nr:PAS domain-containing protein [Williamwhitmania taraxaci]SDC82591.1 PAS domain S-box-containing protein [Williamwhitmania taraxaci]
MKQFQRLDIHKKIHITAIALLVVLYVASAVILNSFTKARNEHQNERIMAQILTDISQSAAIVEVQTKPGFDAQDKQLLKNVFHQSYFLPGTFPYIVDEKGFIINDLFREGQKIRKDIFDAIRSNTQKEGSFNFSEESRNGNIEKTLYFQYFKPYNGYICLSVDTAQINQATNSNKIYLGLIVFLVIFIFYYGLKIILGPISLDIKSLSKTIDTMADGMLPEHLSTNRVDDFGKLIDSTNELIDNLGKTAIFADEIGKNNLLAEYAPASKEDVLGNALVRMRESLLMNQKEETIRKTEGEKQNWVTLGLAKFGEILRQNNNDLTLLSEHVIQHLINYLNANQGGIFALNDEDGQEKALDLVASFAYNRKKHLTKQIMFGEGLVGTCANEKQTIHLKEIPNDYITITSGLGEATPTNLLIVPLTLEDSVFGVIEIASFSEFQPHEIEFVEKLSHSIASTLSSVKINIRTTYLLEQSQQQREEMAAQEEEMRQNMEEMQATQEEMQRKTAELQAVNTAIDEALLQGELEVDGSVINLNQNFLNILGLGRDEIMDRTIFSLAPATTSREIKSLWNSVSSGNSEKGVFHFNSTDGDDRFLMLSFSPAFDEMGSFIKVIVLGQDVTETKNLEQKAKKQAQEIEKNIEKIEEEQEIAKIRQKEIDAMLLALNQNVIVSEMTGEGRITFINQKNVDTLGDTPDKIVGKYHRDLDFTAKNNPEAYKLFWNNLMNGVSQERIFSLKVGSETKWIREEYTPVPDENGSIFKIITLGFDVTAEKVFEQEVEELKKEAAKRKDR